MKFDLIMHFRFLPNSWTIAPMGCSNVDSCRGITIYAEIDNQKYDKKVLRWGASICNGVPFQKSIGIERAKLFILKNRNYNSINDDYLKIKDFAEFIAKRIAKCRSVIKGFESITDHFLPENQLKSFEFKFSVSSEKIVSGICYDKLKEDTYGWYYYNSNSNLESLKQELQAVKEELQKEKENHKELKNMLYVYFNLKS